MRAFIFLLSFVAQLTMGYAKCMAQKTGVKKPPYYPKMFLIAFYEDTDTIATNLTIGKAKGITLKLDRIKETVTFLQPGVAGIKLMGHYKYDLPDVAFLQFEDLESDGGYELLLSTSHNMNGNKFMEVYKYSKASNNIVYAGSLNTHYKINRAKKTIEVSYTGSSWMGEFLQLYKWYGNKLLPVKKIESWYERVSEDSSVLLMAYYTNPTRDKDSLLLQWQETVCQPNKNAGKIWDSFFNK